MKSDMKCYDVTGMSCAACSAQGRRRSAKWEGVSEVGKPLTNSMNVEGTASPEAVIQAVEKAGYGAHLKAGSGEGKSREAGVSAGAKDTDGDLGASQHREFVTIRNRLIASLVFLIPLMGPWDI